LTIEPELFLGDGVGYFGSRIEEIKILSNWFGTGRRRLISPKCILVENVVGLIQLIT